LRLVVPDIGYAVSWQSIRGGDGRTRADPERSLAQRRDGADGRMSRWIDVPTKRCADGLTGHMAPLVRLTSSLPAFAGVSQPAGGDRLVTAGGWQGLPSDVEIFELGEPCQPPASAAAAG